MNERKVGQSPRAGTVCVIGIGHAHGLYWAVALSQTEKYIPTRYEVTGVKERVRVSERDR